jgi:hypothetical protein
MKITGAIARLLLGFMFLVIGLNMFFNFIPSGPLPPGHAGEFFGALLATHFMFAVGAVMGVSGILLLFNRYVALGLTLLGPVLVNILLFHIFMSPRAAGMALFASLLWLLVAWQHRAAFIPLFLPRLQG